MPSTNFANQVAILNLKYSGTNCKINVRLRSCHLPVAAGKSTAVTLNTLKTNPPPTLERRHRPGRGNRLYKPTVSLMTLHIRVRLP